MSKKIIDLLQSLIATPSFSREEKDTADLIAAFFEKYKITTLRQGNNVWVKNKYWKEGLPCVLLNSHHDTVKPVKAWVRNPFSPDIDEKNGILYGLGSNDAGGPLVSLIATFLHFYESQSLHFNLILAATAEEEISGANGISSILNELGTIDLGIVGEPTQMQMAIAEKGLMVIDAFAYGKAGHAAREEGVNAIYIALKDIEKIRNYDFLKVSSLLGKTKATVTQIEAGTQHNVVPDLCKFVIDVRSNEEYSNEEIYHLLKKEIQSELKPRSFTLNSSKIELNHPLVQRGIYLGLSHYGSPTLSDQALLPFPTLKIGPGDSARSHTADEFIYLEEIYSAITIYCKLLDNLKL